MTSNIFTAELCLMCAGLNEADREMLELQRQLKNYTGTLTGKVLLKKGGLKKCTRKGKLKSCNLFVVSEITWIQLHRVPNWSHILCTFVHVYTIFCVHN